jgi:uroporphyrinogen-III synthase
VPAIPGAAGILAELPVSLDGARILWPRASDADTAPLAELVRRGAQVAAPVVYEKRPRRPEPEILARLLSGKFDAIAVSSLAALDALVVALEGVPLPPVIWGAIGPESARQLIARGLPRPVVPLNPTIAELVEALRESG